MADDGSIDIGMKLRPRGPDQPAAKSLVGTNVSGLKNEHSRVCVAMTQQSGEFGRGNQSAPQKLLQLVGYRDPKARFVPWVRPLPAKR